MSVLSFTCESETPSPFWGQKQAPKDGGVGQPAARWDCRWSPQSAEPVTRPSSLRGLTDRTRWGGSGSSTSRKSLFLSTVLQACVEVEADSCPPGCSASPLPTAPGAACAVRPPGATWPHAPAGSARVGSCFTLRRSWQPWRRPRGGSSAREMQ